MADKYTHTAGAFCGAEGLAVGEKGAEITVAGSDGSLYHKGTKLTGTTIANGTQANHIANPTGGTTTDAEARTAINSILSALEAFGITKTS